MVRLIVEMAWEWSVVQIRVAKIVQLQAQMPGPTNGSGEKEGVTETSQVNAGSEKRFRGERGSEDKLQTARRSRLEE
jgi:hypothetical protein